MAADRAGLELHATVAGAEHHGGRALVGRAQHEEVQRLAHHLGGEHLLGGDRLAEHGVVVVHAVGAVLHHDVGEVVLGDAGVDHERWARRAK